MCYFDIEQKKNNRKAVNQNSIQECMQDLCNRIELGRGVRLNVSARFLHGCTKAHATTTALTTFYSITSYIHLKIAISVD